MPIMSCALISSDYFISFFIHCRHSISFSPTYTLAFQFQHPHTKLYDHSVLVHCERSTTHRVVRSLDLSFLPCRPPNKIAVKASCDDLILCSFKHYFRNDVCNPQTNQHVALPPPAFNHYRDLAFGLLSDPAPCSFCRDCGGADNTRSTFMAMRIRVPEAMRHITQLHVQLFSSEEGEWRNYVVSSSRWTLTYLNIESLVPYKGKLHWLVFPYVLVFDPYNAPGQICRVIHLPFGHHGPRTLPPVLYSFCVFNDRLRFAYTETQEMCHYIRELEDYDTGVWRLAQKLARGGLLIGPYILPGDGNVICENPDSSATWLCNFQSDGVMDNNKYELIPSSFAEQLYDISSVEIADQCWPTPIPSLQLRP